MVLLSKARVRLCCKSLQRKFAVRIARTTCGLRGASHLVLRKSKKGPRALLPVCHVGTPPSRFHTAKTQT